MLPPPAVPDPRALRCPGGFFLILLAVLGAGLIGQAPSRQTSKDRLEKEIKDGNADGRRQAIEEFAAHGHAEVVRLLHELLRRRLDRIEELKPAIESEAQRVLDLKKEATRIAGLVKTGKLGDGATEKIQSEIKAAEDGLKKLKSEAELETATVPVLRRALANSVGVTPENERASVLRILTQAVKDAPNGELRSHLLRAIVWIELPEAEATITDQLASADAVQRMAGLAALEERGGLRALRAALKVLHDPVWQVQARVIQILRDAGGLEAARSLIEVMEKSKGRIQSDALAALIDLTGEDFHESAPLWREWLDKEGARLPSPGETANAPKRAKPKSDDEAKGQRGTGFYGIKTASKHIVYVIDYSGSMTATLYDAKEQSNDASPPKPNGDRKVDGAATELLKSIDALSKDCTFNVVLFATAEQSWRDKMAPATLENKQDVRAWVLKRPPVGATNLFGGVERAFKYVGRGAFDKHYKAQADTIILLSDGAPSAGRFTATADILREIKAINELSRIAIHTVGLGRQINADLLMRLASENAGQFVHIRR